jgi:hypothetical protein
VMRFEEPCRCSCTNGGSVHAPSAPREWVITNGTSRRTRGEGAMAVETHSPPQRKRVLRSLPAINATHHDDPYRKRYGCPVGHCPYPCACLRLPSAIILCNNHEAARLSAHYLSISPSLLFSSP